MGGVALWAKVSYSPSLGNPIYKGALEWDIAGGYELALGWFLLTPYVGFKTGIGFHSMSEIVTLFATFGFRAGFALGPVIPYLGGELGVGKALSNGGFYLGEAIAGHGVIGVEIPIGPDVRLGIDMGCGYGTCLRFGATLGAVL